ncbi:MAG: permease-like cell division protein FtsX [Coriobacteriia bacterium]|nr:permease-like cell division protein FtsX [Coriobacteriia bacterium]
MAVMVTFRLGYSLHEAFSHFKRNLSTSLGAVVTIFLSLFIIGLFSMGTLLVNNLVGDVESRVTIQAFISDDAETGAINALADEFRGIASVQEVQFKDKDEALAEYRETMANENAIDAIAQLDGQNPVPASLVIRLDDPQQVEAVANQVMANQNFIAIADSPENIKASVQYGAGSVEKLFTATNYMRIVGIVLVVLLVFVAFVFINNTIRLSIMARRREISIMRLVGASNSFIRGPFVMEGIVQALFGCLFAIVSLELIRNFLFPSVTNSLQFLPLVLDAQDILIIYAILLGIGLFIGLFGSALAMRRYLKV